jgi:hypothetical protein
MWENVVQPDRPQMTVRLMRIACRIIKARDTHVEYVLLLLLDSNNGCTKAPQRYVIRTYVACIVGTWLAMPCVTNESCVVTFGTATANRTNCVRCDFHVTWCLCTNIHGVTFQKREVIMCFLRNVQHAEANVGQFRTIADARKCVGEVAYRVTQTKWHCWGLKSGPWSYFLVNCMFCIVAVFVHAELYFVFMEYCCCLLLRV